jgi:hypothetical protein
MLIYLKPYSEAKLKEWQYLYEPRIQII